MRYFEETVTNGEWDEVEKYLSGFTKVDDNRYSMKIFFEIRKQKYLEALDKYVLCDSRFCFYLLDSGSDRKHFVNFWKNCRRDRAKAVEILVKDLKVFSAFNEELFKEITQLLTLENFRYGMSCCCLYFVLACLPNFAFWSKSLGFLMKLC